MTDKPATSRAHRSSWLLAPVLAAIYPVVAMYAESSEEANLSDALLCGAATAGIAVAVAYLLRPIYKDPTRTSLAAFTLIAWIFMFNAYRRLGKMALETMSTSRWNDYFLMALWFALLGTMLIALWKLRWTAERLRRLNRFVQLACLFTVACAALPIARAGWHTQSRTTGPAAIWASDEEKTGMNLVLTPLQPERDVYFMVFDRYANQDVLAKYFDFDNSEFNAALEKRGFVVDRHATTCYPMTAPSMASTLNMRFLNPQFDNVANYFPAVDANDVARLFLNAGYKYYYYGNLYAPLRKSSLAQWNMRISMLPGEFADSLVTMTPLRPLIGRQYKHHFTVNKFNELAALARNPERTFSYAHFLVPHPPYVFASDGSPLSEIARATRPESELYVDQLVATNRMIMAVLDEILTTSQTKPIIIILADEGPYLMPGDASLSREEQIEKRSGILSAVYIPDDDIRGRLPKPLLPVNAFRFLFKEYFAAPIELLPNHRFYWAQPDSLGVPSPDSEIVEIPAAE